MTTQNGSCSSAQPDRSPGSLSYLLTTPSYTLYGFHFRFPLLLSYLSGLQQQQQDSLEKQQNFFAVAPFLLRGRGKERFIYSDLDVS